MAKKEIFFIISFFTLFAWEQAHAATLSLLPATGTFSVGSTFEVSLYLNTKGESVNAVEAYLQFPEDKLQVISPSTGQSLIGLWVSQPKYNNNTGQIELRGGIPEGINVSDGVITKILFRVRGTGSALIQFRDNSRVLLHDGKGTNTLSQTHNALLQLTLPPPAGPVVVSGTHPDQSAWKANNAPIFEWPEESTIEGYSYVLNEKPIDIPDNISEGVRNGVSYENLPDGVHYFHLKALREGAWGGVTHYAVRIDATPPAEFPIGVFPSKRTSQRQPTFTFDTTDNLSGIDYHEMKIISLKGKNAVSAAEIDQPFFFESKSPHLVAMQLELGTYDVIVRTYDKAGNFRDVTQRFRIVPPFFQTVFQEGFQVRGLGIIPWFIIWGALIVISGIIFSIAWLFRKKHKSFEKHKATKILPDPVQEQLEKLKQYQKKYGKLVVLIAIGTIVTMSFLVGSTVFAQQRLSPPVINELSSNVSNDEIFYAGGVTEFPNTKVTLFLQNENTGELESRTITSTEKGEWFYRHDVFLSPGSYAVWAQSERAEEQSAPSAQREILVHTGALEFGSSRISYEVIAVGVSVLLVLVLIGTSAYMVIHMRHTRRRHRELMKEVREAEESIRRGFAVLKRDIQSELVLIRQANLGKKLSLEQKKREEQLLRDLEWAEQFIGKEVWDIEKLEHKN